MKPEIKYSGWLETPVTVTTAHWNRIAYTENALSSLINCANTQKISYKLENKK